MTPESLSRIAKPGCRVALATSFLSSVAGRLGLWGKYGGDWEKAALGSSVLLTLFAMAMFSSDPKSPFDYSVFTAAFAALTLATHPARD